jgi:hypothetical protein
VGLADGRYLARASGEATDVLVCATIGAPPRRRWRRARARAVDREAEVEPLPLTRLTVVVPQNLGGAAEAERWLDRVAGDADEAGALIDRALVLVNRALHAHATAAQDPYVPELSAERAVATRLGYGEGEQVSEGSWTDARELLRRQPRRRRADSLQPQERVAAVLGGRDTVSPSEAVLLRARLDLDQGRIREAALQLHAGLAALLAELAPGRDPNRADELAALKEREARVSELARHALEGELDGEGEAALTETLALCERALRRRRFST